MLNARRLAGASLAVQLVGETLDLVPASLVAKDLGVSDDLVYGWSYGRSAITLGDALAAPVSFGRRLLVLSLEHVDLRRLAVVDPHEAMNLLLTTLGRLLLVSQQPLPDEDEMRRRELRQRIEQCRLAERQSADLARGYEAELRQLEQKGEGK